MWDTMLDEAKIRKLLDDIRTAYEIGYQNNDLDTEAEKWGQIQILEWILSKWTPVQSWLATNNEIKAYLILNTFHIVPDTKKKINTTKDDYDKALASDDPTKISAADLENLAKEAMRKFKSLWIRNGLLLESYFLEACLLEGSACILKEEKNLWFPIHFMILNKIWKNLKKTKNSLLLWKKPN